MADDDINPGDSASHVSGSSSASVRRLDLIRQRAELKAQLALCKEQHELQFDELKLQQRRAELENRTKILALDEEERHLADPELQHESESDNEVILNPRAAEFRPAASGMPSTLPMTDVINSLRLPAVELMEYDGNPLKYWSFIRTFESTVENCTSDCATKLARLVHYCTGKARKVIECCSVMEPEAGYAKARELLRQRFGNNYLIAEAWVKKISEGNPIKAGDRDRLQNFSDDLASCIETLSTMKFTSELNNQSTLLKVAEQLPHYLQVRVKRELCRLRESGKIPDMKFLAKLIREAANEANDPVFGGLAVPVREAKQVDFRSRTPSKHIVQGRHSTTLAASSVVPDTQPRRQMSVGSSHTGKVCPMCQETHSLFGCERFKHLSVDDRLKFVRQNRLCFNCLSPGHISANCSLNRRCTVQGCGKNHTKFLHPVNDQVNNNNQVVEVTSPPAPVVHNGLIGAGSVKTALPIVPVVIMNPDNNLSCQTYALLDGGSTNSFCCSRVVQSLSLSERHQNLSLTTLAEANAQVTTTSVSLEVSDLLGSFCLSMPVVYTRDALPISLSCKATVADISDWPHLSGVQFPEINVGEIGLLIGQDNPDALAPLEVRRPDVGTSAPHATRTIFGWTLNGPLGRVARGQRSVHTNFIQSDDDLEQQVSQLWTLDSVPEVTTVPLSPNDRKALDIWERSIVHGDDSHYEVAIPFKERPPVLSNNIDIAQQRLVNLKARLRKDSELHTMYSECMNDLLKKGYAEEVPNEALNASLVWYLPHHAVLNPNKPGKVRVVFDCSAKHCGKSLNDVVLQGPDLTSKLIGVLLRFRQEHIALIADIEAMFHQIWVSPSDRDVLRFLWWRDGKLDAQPTVHRMKVHLFGGIWSPSCCSFVLRRTAEDSRNEFDEEVTDTVLNNFYVDDCLKSVDTVEQAVYIIEQLTSMLKGGGFRLTKWISNSREVMSVIPEAEQPKKIQSLDLQCEALPVERALGVRWDIEADALSFSAAVRNKPLTRRGMLSIVSSVFDPLGFLSPFVLPAKRMMQDLCRRKVHWDDSLAVSDEQSWKQWLTDLQRLDHMKQPRCLKPPDFGDVAMAELHHFSDASSYGYGAVSYLRQVNHEGRVHCTFVISKSRVAPMRETTIPRLELCAAVLSVKLDCMLRHELDIKLSRSVFWTDSTVVLRYIHNEDKRFHTFVANRVATIHELSLPTQWQYVNTDLNPADDVSRGLRAEEIMNSTRWFRGPQFLWQEEDTWPQNPLLMDDVTDCDPEVKRNPVMYMTQVKSDDVFDQLFKRRSSWYELKRDVAHLLRVRQYLYSKSRGLPLPDMMRSVTVAELKNSELEIIKYVQRQVFSQEMKAVHDGAEDGKTISVNKSSHLYRLEPTTVGDGVLRVGGRLQSHPIILPNNHAVSNLIIAHFHVVSGHCGKEYVLAQIRLEYWIVRARSAVRRVLAQCSRCKLRDIKPAVQQMANLPSIRTTPGEPPFSYVGVDLFGPFFVKRGRVQMKRYGCLFTCLKIRAVHIEVVHSLDTDSFINALQRFVCRRGQVKMIQSDNGTNFVGAEKELRVAVESWNTNRIDNFLRQNSIQWHFNPPSASHMGGVWERQIRSVRRILSVLMKEQVVDDESLSTLFCLVESIINNRPLTTVSDDHRDLEPLTPNHLLLMRQSPELPPGEFVKQDCYSRRRWRQVQYLADVFWKRWVREYIPTLRLRQKWHDPVRNIMVGDVVLLADDNAPRHTWNLGRVSETYSSADGLVRSVKVTTRGTELIRPVHKLCLLEPVETCQQS